MEPLPPSERAEIFAQAVAMFLAGRIGEAQANAIVLRNLSIVLRRMNEGERADQLAMKLCASAQCGTATA
jgi:hypothetical protein